MVRFISRNDLVIVPLTEAEYLAQFDSKFENPKDSAPQTYKSLDELLDDVLGVLGHDEIRDMIAAQTNPFYKDAVLIRAIARGKFNTLDSEEKMNLALRYRTPDWSIDKKAASALHKCGMHVRFYRVVDGVAQFVDDDAVVIGVFQDHNKAKWIAITTQESKALAVNNWIENEPVERELLEQHMFEQDEQGQISDKISYMLGRDAVREWVDVC